MGVLVISSHTKRLTNHLGDKLITLKLKLWEPKFILTRIENFSRYWFGISAHSSSFASVITLRLTEHLTQYDGISF